MTLDEFKASLNESVPEGLSDELQALWIEADGNWDKAHRIVQSINSEDAAWVHAYLHRKEGDEGNAGYWYRMANKDFPQYDLNTEWNKISEALLKKM